MKTHAHELGGHHSHRPLYIRIFVALMVLLVLTVVAAKIPMSGEWNIGIAMGIAVLKAALILLFFMHFRDSDHLTWLIGAATVVWFVIMIVLTLNDYTSRDWMRMPGK